MPALPFLSHASLPRRLQWALAAVLFAALLWAALAPLHYPTRERLLEFPHGAAVLRGQASPVLVPAELRLTLGVRDVLLLRNRDLAPHVFGQVLVLPGHEVRLPFEQAGDYPFACVIPPASCRARRRSVASSHTTRLSSRPRPMPVAAIAAVGRLSRVASSRGAERIARVQVRPAVSTTSVCVNIARACAGRAPGER